MCPSWWFDLGILCEWWTNVAVPVTQARSWVSGLHLDFQASMNGPILYNRMWFSSDDLPEGHGVDMVRRVRVFTGLLRSFLDDNAYKLESSHIRPHGVAIGIRIASYHLRFSQERFNFLDSHVLRVVGRQITRLSDLNLCVVPEYTEAWRLAR